MVKYKIDEEIINDVENEQIVVEESKFSKISMVTALGKAGIKKGFDKYKNMTLEELKNEKEKIDNRIDEIKANNTEMKYDAELKKQNELQDKEADMSFDLAEAEVYENKEKIERLKAEHDNLRQEVNVSEKNVMYYENKLNAENKEIQSLNKEKSKIDKEISKRDEEDDFERELSASVQQIMDEANTSKNSNSVEEPEVNKPETQTVNSSDQVISSTQNANIQETQTVNSFEQVISSNNSVNEKPQLDLSSIKLVNSQEQADLIRQQQEKFTNATIGVFSALAGYNKSVIESQNKNIELLKEEIIKLRKENIDLQNNHNLEVQKIKNENDLKVQSLNGNISELKGKLEAETTEKENLSQELSAEKIKSKNLEIELAKAKQFASKINSQFQQFKSIIAGAELNDSVKEENGFTKQK